MPYLGIWQGFILNYNNVFTNIFANIGTLGLQLFFILPTPDFVVKTMILDTEESYWWIWGIATLSVSNQDAKKGVFCMWNVHCCFFNESLENCKSVICYYHHFHHQRTKKWWYFKMSTFSKKNNLLSDFDVTFYNLFIFMGYWWVVKFL